MFETIKQKIKDAWKKAWTWCKNSGTILMSYIYGLVGIVTAFIGSIDFAPLWNFLQTGTAFTKNQVIWIGVGILGAGVVNYFVRISSTKEVDNNLVPVSTETMEVKTKVKKAKKPQ